MLIDITIYFEDENIEIEIDDENDDEKIIILDKTIDLLNYLRVLNYHHNINNILIINNDEDDEKINKIVEIIENEINLNVNY